MKIVVTTPTGHVGSRVVTLLLQAGFRPTLLLRDASRLDDDVRAHVDVIEGDQRDADAVRGATAGADALYWVNPPTDADDPVDAQRAMAEIVATAVTTNAVGRTVRREAPRRRRHRRPRRRRGRPRPHGRLGYAPALRVLHQPAPRPRPAGRPVSHRAAVDQPMPWVDPRDIGEIAAARLLNTTWAGRHIRAVHGPEHLTWEQACAILEAAAGRPLRVKQVPDE